MSKHYTLLWLLLSGSFAAFSQVKMPATLSHPPALSAITEADLRRDLYAMAGDHFRGREAGTLDELKASVWWANKLREAGLQPAGDDSTFLQFFNLKRNRIGAQSSITIGNKPLFLWKDVLVAQTAPASLSVPIVDGGDGSPETLDKLNIKGNAVAVHVSAEGIDLNVSLPERRYPGYVYRKYGKDLLDRGAAAIIFIADDTAEKSWPYVQPNYERGQYDVEGGSNATVTAKVPVLWLHANAATAYQLVGNTLHVQLIVETFDYPSVNIIGKIEGRDPKLKGEYVLFSGHTDHDGVRNAINNDSIYNGADDNATVNVALLAIARAFKANPGRRSALFVWHGAEERGLLGSKWYAVHPTVDKNAIVAVLNGDMIGYNNPDSAALLGSEPPHRNSATLVNMALEANREGPNFKLDTLWDKPAHIEGWYFRSDHLSYARAGYPAIFYTTLLHKYYHTPMDAPDIINIPKLARMTQWMYRTGWKVANADNRPAVDAGFKLER